MSIKRWYAVHKWTSLVCTAFLLLICLTGLPLVFAAEIDQWMDPHIYATLPAGTPAASLDKLVDASHTMFPGQIVTSITIDDDEPQVTVWMAPSFTAAAKRPDVEHFIRYDARTASVLDTSRPPSAQKRSFVEVMFHLHTDLFAGLPGELFLGAMALCFVVATVSGVVLYAPFMRRLDFGSIRRNSGPRIRWLDMHNLIGIATLAWLMVVGVTGLLNELSAPLFAIWQHTHVQPMLAPPHGDTAVVGERSAQAVYDTVHRALPGMSIISISYPGAAGGSPRHYFVWTHGSTPLSGRLYTPALVEAGSGRLTSVIAMPWYLRALELSRPLHFGDYAGLPLKVLWVVLDLMAITVLATGLYLWIARRRDHAARVVRIEAVHARTETHRS